MFGLYKRYLSLVLLIVLFGCSNSEESFLNDSEQPKSFSTNSKSMANNNVKLLNFNVAIGASRLYNGNCYPSTNPEITDIRFGDFNEDGIDDVFAVFDQQWRYASGGENGWMDLNSASNVIDNLRFGDFDGDGKTDVFSVNSNGQWRYSSGGVSNWIYMDTSYMLYCDTQSSCVKPLMLLEESISEIVDLVKNEFVAQNGIVCLQEVNTNVNGVNILQEIKNELGGTWDYEFFSPMGTTYGIATLSNIEWTKKQLWNLPKYQQNEERGAIAQKFKFQNKFLWVVNTHLD